MDAIVVTYNGAPEIEGLLTCQPLREAFERVVVVDNASSDGTAQLARRHGATVVERPTNAGLAVAVNAGARLVNGDAFAVLNPDVRLASPDVVPRLRAHFADPSVGLVAPALELPSGALQDSAREVPSPLDLWRRRVRGAPLDAIQSDRVRTVPWVVAAFMIIRRDAFEEVGGFDERYFLYFEDVDIAVRLRRRAGYRVVYDPTARALHAHAAASRGSLMGWAARQHMRSACRFYAHHPGYLLPRRWRPTREPAASGPRRAHR
jgi:N-acetylglucosaminyl-diphospho-decaprenol L-rhamnosyltransferase